MAKSQIVCIPVILYFLLMDGYLLLPLRGLTPSEKNKNLERGEESKYKSSESRNDLVREYTRKENTETLPETSKIKKFKDMIKEEIRIRETDQNPDNHGHEISDKKLQKKKRQLKHLFHKRARNFKITASGDEIVKTSKSMMIFRTRMEKHSVKKSKGKHKKRGSIVNKRRNQIDGGDALVITGDDNSDSTTEDVTPRTSREEDATSQTNEMTPNNRQTEEIVETIDRGINSILPYPGGSPPRAEEKPQTGGNVVVIQPGKYQQTESGIEIENVPTQNTICTCSNIGHNDGCTCTPSAGVKIKPSVPSTDITIELKGMNSELMMNGFVPILKYWYLLYLSTLQGKVTDPSLSALGGNLGDAGCSSGLMKVFKNGLSAASNDAGKITMHSRAGTNTETISSSSASARASASAGVGSSTSSSLDEVDPNEQFVVSAG